MALVRDAGKFYRRVHRLARPMRKDYRKRFSLTLRQWMVHHQGVVFDKCHWMGIHAWKNPLDAWVYQEIIHETRPDIILEIGSLEGGSTLYLANLLDLLGKGRVISVDIDRARFSVKHDRIVALTGSSASPEIISKVFDLCLNKSALIIQDGAHDKESVLNDLRNYCSLVAVNSYFIVEDGIIDLFTPGDGIGTHDDGPLAAIEQFLRENRDFVVDDERERYILTYNPRGFLKRIR